MRKSNPHFLAFLAIVIMPLSGLAIDINVPSLPAISHYFHVNKSWAQLTITIYILGYGLSQLLAGGLSDSLGRRKQTLLALVFFILTSLCIPWSSNIVQLILLRLLQGITVGFFNAPMRAVLPDLFTGRALYKVSNYSAMIWGLGPIIGPVIGGYLQQYFGWQAPFYFLVGYAVFVLILHSCFMTETLSHRQPYTLKNTVNNYRSMLTHRRYLFGLFCLGLIYSFQVLFGVVGAFLLQNVLHYSPIEFGHMALWVGAAWFLGNSTSRLLLRISTHIKLIVCYWLVLIVTLCMLAINLVIPNHAYNIVIPTIAIMYLNGISFPSFSTELILLFPKIPGSAGALISAFVMVITSSSSLIGALLKTNTQLPLTITFVVLAVLTIISYHASTKKNTTNPL